MSTLTDLTGLLDLQTMQEAVIPLEPEHYERAIHLSHLALNEPHQWRSYINALGLFGFLDWLEQHTSHLAMQPEACSLFQPQYSSLLDAVCHLTIADFKLCLIVIESVASELVSVPRAVVDLPQFTAHLYILLEVQEEREQLILRGCLRYDQLFQFQLANQLSPQPDWSYSLPLDWFDPASHHVLFYLRFLEPTTLSFPTTSPVAQPITQVDLEQALSQINPHSELWQQLTWEQGAALLTNPELLNSYYLQQQQQQGISLPQAGTEGLTQLGQFMINVWHWSQQNLNLSLPLSWSIPQPLTPAFAMRRMSDRMEAIVQDVIQSQHIAVPHHAHFAYTAIDRTPFQLCAVTWLLHFDQPNLEDADLAQEWALLLILVAQPGKALPPGTRLQVSATNVLADVVLETSDVYLYVFVEGEQNEVFTPKILSPQAEPILLPSFTCRG